MGMTYNPDGSTHTCHYYTEQEFADAFPVNDNCTASILHVNARSLCKNFDSIISMLHSLGDFNFSFIAISETWFNNTTSHGLYNIDGYNFIHNDRIDRRGGGVALYIKSSINYVIRDDLNRHLTNDAETIFIEVQNGNQANVIIGIIYRPPDNQLASFNNSLCSCLDALSNEHKDCFLAGDFNVNLLNDVPCYNTQLFVDTLSSYFFQPTIHKCTRVCENSSTLIDNIFTNKRSHVVKSGIIASDISDHFPIFNICNVNVKQPYPKESSYFHNTSVKNILRLRQELLNTDWTNVMCEPDADSAYSKFSGVLNETFQRCCPLTLHSRKINYTKSPWISKGILKSIRHKSKLFSRFKITHSHSDKVKFTQYRNILSIVIKKAKKMYYGGLIERKKDNTSELWKILNSIIGKSTRENSPSEFKSGNSVLIDDDNCIANEFNKYFTSVAKGLSDKLPLSNTDPLIGITNLEDSFMIFPTSPNEISALIHGFKDGKSPGYDGITNTVLKHISDAIAFPLSHIINRSFLSGVFPSEFKLAKVIPIFKSGDNQVFSNYRPVSLLSSISKIFERLMYNRLINFLDKNSVLSTFQHGFRKNHSTDTAILNLVDMISLGLDDKRSTIGIFLDLSKAFDTIDHAILLRKLYAYGIRGNAYNWFASYLSNRAQCVYYKNVSSCKINCNVGVPQGSILGPLLFLLYINNIHMSSSIAKFVLFADDTTVLFQQKTLNEAIVQAETEFCKIYHWLNANKLSLNISKTKVVIFDFKMSSTSNVYLNLAGTPVSPSSNTKFLGTIIDNKLSWNDHILDVSKKVAKSSGILYKIKSFITQSTLITLYNALVLPHMNYGILAWGNTCKTYMNNLLYMQKRVVRNIYNAHFTAHTAPLFMNANILPVRELYKYKLGIFMFKFHNGLLPPTFNAFFTYNNALYSYNTRSRSNLHIPRSRTKLTHSQMRTCGVTLWNSLPSEITSKRTIHTFKLSLKKYLFGSLAIDI